MLGRRLDVKDWNTMRWKGFVVGFSCGFTLFVVANIYSYSQAIPPCCDFSTSFGVPFELGTVGGYVGQTNLSWFGIVVNTSIALCSSILLGMVFAKQSPPILKVIERGAMALGAWHRTRL
jgi:hypothetical protein